MRSRPLSRYLNHVTPRHVCGRLGNRLAVGLNIQRGRRNLSARVRYRLPRRDVLCGRLLPQAVALVALSDQVVLSGRLLPQAVALCFVVPAALLRRLLPQAPADHGVRCPSGAVRLRPPRPLRDGLPDVPPGWHLQNGRCGVYCDDSSAISFPRRVATARRNFWRPRPRKFTPSPGPNSALSLELR